MKHKIDCKNCGFYGTLSTKQEEYSKSDIAFCPACGADILEEYADEDSEEE